MSVGDALGAAASVIETLGLVPMIQAIFVIVIAGAAVAMIRRMRE